MRLYFHILDDRPPDVGIRKFREISRDGMAEVGNLYETAFKMRHFEEGASSRYGYRPRTEGHKKKKARAVARRSFKISPDANRDLIMSGALRRAVGMRHVARAYPTRVTVTMPTPSYAQMKPKRGNMPNLGAEITAVTGDEYAQMQKVYHDSVEHDLNHFRATRKRTIG